MRVSAEHELFRKIADTGKQLAASLEKGQADAPLAGYFERLFSGLGSAPFCIALLGFTQEARTRVLSWLTGQEFSQLSITVSQQSGLVEVHLGERGYSFEKAGGERQEFDRLEPFLEAMRRADLVRHGDSQAWIDPVRFGFEAAKGVQSLDLLIPDSLPRLRENPALLGRLLAATNCVAVVAESGFVPTDESMRWIEDLMAHVPAIWPIVLDAAPGNDSATGWVARLPSPQIRLPVFHLRDGNSSELPSFLADTTDPLRMALFRHHHSQLFTRAIDTLDERLQQEIRHLQARTGREARRLRAAEDEGRQVDPQGLQNITRYGLADEIGAISQDLAEQQRKAALPGGPLLGPLTKLLEGLATGDLVQQPGHKEIALTLDDRFQQQLNEALRYGMHAHVQQLIRVVHEGVGFRIHRFEDELQKHLGFPVTLPAIHMDEAALWASLKDSVQLDVRYRGAAPKRGFFQRLGEGRRAVFMMMMTISLVGTLVGFNWRSFRLIGPIFLLLFAGFTVYTYFSWQKEDAERIDKELDRVRDSLHTEVKRAVTDFQRELTMQLGSYLDRVKRELARTVERLAQQHQGQVRSQLDRKREEARSKQRLLDGQVRQLQSLTPQIDALRRDGTQLVNDCLAALHKTAPNISQHRAQVP